MKIQLNKRHILLFIGLAMVWLVQAIPSWGAFYAKQIYPVSGRLLSGFSNLFPFAIGDLFVIGLSYAVYGEIESIMYAVIVIFISAKAIDFVRRLW